MNITAGVFIINNKNEILLVHPTSAKWDSWSIPKGLVEKNEIYSEAAKREVLEETNINLDTYDLRYVGESKYKKRSKKLVAYYVPFKSDGYHYDLKCNSTFIHKKSGDEIFENDKVEWHSIDSAKELIHHTQLELLNFLIHGK